MHPHISDFDSIRSEMSENDIPLNTIAKRYRKERYTSSDMEDIPLMELSNKLKQRQIRLLNMEWYRLGSPRVWITPHEQVKNNSVDQKNG